MSKSPACSLLMLALSALSTAHSLASTEGAIRTCGRTSRARLARLPPVLPPGLLTGLKLGLGFRLGLGLGFR